MYKDEHTAPASRGPVGDIREALGLARPGRGNREHTFMLPQCHPQVSDQLLLVGAESIHVSRIA